VVGEDNFRLYFIELVVVIVILGVLVAVAIPRYSKLQSDAVAAKMQGVYATMISSIALAKSHAQIQGVVTGTVTIDGDTIQFYGSNPRADWSGSFVHLMR